MIRNIATKFYFRRSIQRINRSIHGEEAVLHCVRHMRSNRYQSSIAEVVDESDGELLAVVTRNIKGEIKIVYRKEYVAPPAKDKKSS